MAMGSATQFQTTTVRLPKDLYEQARTAVKEAGAASSINDFLVEAVQEKLQQLREQEIDNSFAEMAHDEEYKNEAVALTCSFEQSDWQAYRATTASIATNERRRKKGSAKTSPR